jgi:GT2 family glycosyltransferase
MLLRAYEPNLDDPFAVPLGGSVVLVAWDAEGLEPGALDATADGGPLEKRRAALRISLGRGRTRMLLAVRVPASTGALSLGRRGHPAARLDLGTELSEDPSPLVQGLDAAGAARLVGFVLGICRATFQLGDDPGFARLVRRLVDGAPAAAPASVAPRAAILAGQLLCDVTLPPAGADGTIFLLSGDGVRELVVRPRVTGRQDGAVRCAVALPALAAGERVLLVGAAGLQPLAVEPAQALPSVVALAQQNGLSPAERAYVLDCLGRLAAEPQALAAARALQLLAPETVRELIAPAFPVAAALEEAIGCGAAGVFVRGWLRDPHGLVGEAELVSPFGRARIADRWRRLARPDLGEQGGGRRPGFVALAPIAEPIEVLQHGLALHTGGGTLEIVAPARAISAVEARDRVLGCVLPPDLDDPLLEDVIAPATSVLHARAMAVGRACEVVEIGRPAARPDASLVIPLYRNLSFIRLQMAAFASDPAFRDGVEIVYVLDSPEQRPELEHLLRGLHLLNGLHARLVVMPANLGYSAANNAGVAEARGRHVVLLNSDVVPIAAGWVGALVRSLERSGAGAIGPKLLFDDGSLQHAGLTFLRDVDGRWYNTHFHKGYPRDWPAANVARSVPGVTGATMVLARATYEEVGGLCEDYVVGDFEDSDLCLRLRARGHDIWYEPAVELFHFERRSIELHPGYTRTIASAYNRRLHMERWGGAIAELMSASDRWYAAAGGRR